MRFISRRAALSALAMLALAACGSASGNGAGASASGSDGDLPDMFLGDADAPVTLIEYASVTCGACLQFHLQVMPTIKADYVDTGLVKFVFREYPTPPVPVAVEGFAIARCAGDRAAYFDTIDDLFNAQPGVLMAARNGTWRSALQEVARRNGIETEQAYMACATDGDIRADIADVILSGEAYQVASTPTLILQGRKLDNTMQSRTAEGLSGLIDLELEALGIEVSAAPEVEETPVEEADLPVEDVADDAEAADETAAPEGADQE